MFTRNKPTTHARMYIEEKKKLKQLARKVSMAEDNDIKIPEVTRRMLNIPILESYLLEDAKAKARKRISHS